MPRGKGPKKGKGRVVSKGKKPPASGVTKGKMPGKNTLQKALDKLGK